MNTTELGFSEKIGLVLVCYLLVSPFLNHGIFAQTDTARLELIYSPKIVCPAYPYNKGPKIYLDEGHNNRHTYDGLGNFVAFRNVLNEDGYQVIPFKEQFSPMNLQNVGILVIPLAQNERNLWPRWNNPTYSAFMRSEVLALKNWVEEGGSLFLITDHHPFPGAVKELAEAFDILLYNGHAIDTVRYPVYFNRANNTLHGNVITNGRNINERIDSIVTYSGSVILFPKDAQPILTFNTGWVQWLPDTAWRFDHIEPESISGLSQGGYMSFIKGKIVVFGDGNMFSAQDDDWSGKIGFIDPNAKYNHKLLLNIIHYLDGLLN